MTEFEKLAVEYVNPKELKVFDYSRKLFPMLQGEAYEFLKNDIQENGIRTPLEVTKEKVILCGHERHRIALELGLEKVPVIFFSSAEVISQKIRCIKDNLARKAVDWRTRIRCYGELRDLYGLKERQNPKNEHGQYRKVSDSVESGGTTEFLTHADIAKEVNLTEKTSERALRIERSDLPEEIKDAAFKGRLGIEPVENLRCAPKEIQKQAIQQILKELQTDKEHIHVQAIIDQIKGEDCEPSEAVSTFLTNYKQALEQFPNENKTSTEKTEAAIQLFKQLLDDKKIVCPKCGEKHLKWSCGHAF
jgi:ParB-like chromosome segregation protein Spo0J